MKISHEFTQLVETRFGNTMVYVPIKFQCFLMDILYVEELVSEDTVASDSCVLCHSKKGEIVVAGSYEDVTDIVFHSDKPQVVGFNKEQPAKKDEVIRTKRRKSRANGRNLNDS